MVKMTQTQKIRKYMIEHGSITSKEAMDAFGCMRLAARIGELIKGGEQIKKTMEEGLNRDGTKSRYTRYSLVTPHQMKLPI